MKRVSRFFAASLATLLIATGVGLASNPIINGVTQVNYQFVINDKVTQVPSQLMVMSKNNTTYVPLRFLSENMGIKIDYKPGTILLNSEVYDASINETASKKIEELQKEVDKLKAENENLKKQVSAAEDINFYQELPAVADNGNGLRVKLTQLNKSTEGLELFVEITNSSMQNYFVVDPFKTVLRMDGKTYNATLSTDAQLNSTLAKAPDEYSPTKLQGRIYIEDVDSTKIKGNLLFSYNDNGQGQKLMQMSFDNTK